MSHMIKPSGSDEKEVSFLRTKFSTIKAAKYRFMDPFEIFSQFMASAAGHSHGHSHAGMIPEEEYEDEEEYEEDEEDYPDGTVACCGPGGCCGGGDDEEELPFPPFLYQYFPVSTAVTSGHFWSFPVPE